MTSEEISLLKQKDETTFNEFYNQYHKLFFSIIFKTIKDFQVTEELVIDVFCKILEDLDQYRGGNFKYWCVTIAKNIAFMYLRKAITERKTLEKYAENETLKIESSEDSDSLSDELLTEIKTIVDGETYEIIILHLVQNMKFREIATIKKVTTSSIIGKYDRGIKKIRSRIDYENYR
ncbi:MAG: RNA polymerase sigma factor [Bacilli bacterium]